MQPTETHIRPRAQGRWLNLQAGGPVLWANIMDGLVRQDADAEASN
jgi:hypothetical protein